MLFLTFIFLKCPLPVSGEAEFGSNDDVTYNQDSLCQTWLLTSYLCWPVF